MKRRYVVLDRDGTIIEECEYLSDPQQIKLLPGAAGALRKLKEMGLGLAIITNQSAIGRGFFNDARLGEIHHRLVELLETERVDLDALYYCPHKPEDACPCRKPEVGLIQKASVDLNFDLEQSIVIGDKVSDVEMGRRVRATTFLVRTGYGSLMASEGKNFADYIVEDLADAAGIIERLIKNEGEAINDH
jgi:D-glycero-D-manno-heptose 1,7-bisphosphate phosphatase